MKDNLAPIVIFAYRRVIDKTIKSLLENNLAKHSKVYIFSDGYSNEKDKDDVEKAREYLKTITGFSEIIIIESSINKGLAGSVIDGVSEIIKKYKKIIVLEDDLIVSNDFLDYMNEALDFYENIDDIWSISGYGPNLHCLKDAKTDVYLSVRASSWGWATWENRWNKTDWEVKDFNKLREEKVIQNKFNLGGNDMYKMLELQMLGKIDSWAIRWCYSQFKFGMYTIYPRKSKIINDGFSDNKGAHNSGSNKKFTMELNNERISFKKLYPEGEIINNFKEFHDLSIKTKIGYFLKKYGGYSFIKRLFKD